MAVTLFSKTSGHVTSFPDPTLPARASVAIAGWEGFTGFKSIITDLTLATQGNYQFLHTLGGNIYVYVFGDRIGQLTVSGLSFENTCDAEGSIGIELVMKYYSDNRLAGRKTPIKVTVGVSTTFTAYLTGIGTKVQDTQARLWQYSLHMALLPITKRKKRKKRKKRVATGGGDSGDVTTDPSGGGDLEWGLSTLADISSEDPDPGGAVSGVAYTAPVTADGYAAVGTGPDTRLTR